MKNKTFYYARVSTKDQNLDRQIAAFKELGADDHDIFLEKKSGKDLERPVYQMVKHAMREGDTLVIKSLDRLSRDKYDMKNELAYYRENHIRVKVIDLPSTMIDLPEGEDWVLEMTNNLLIEVLGTIAEQETRFNKQRQAEGFQAARESGKHLGRPALTFPENWTRVYKAWKAGEITAKEAMEQTGTKRTSFYKLVKQTEEK